MALAAMMWNADDRSKIGGTISECVQWWQQRCLYLNPSARSAFQSACGAALVRHTVEGAEKRKENFARIEALGEELVKGVELPDLGEAEFAKRLRNSSSAKSGEEELT